jgi:hypothetical protein
MCFLFLIYQTKKNKMKNFLKEGIGSPSKTANDPELVYRFNRNAVSLFLAVFIIIVLLNGCSKQDMADPNSKEQSTSNAEMNADVDISSSCAGLSEQTKLELQQVRKATAKYRDINKAIADEYADINVIMQNMGYHYMKSKLADAVFKIEKPELLVYNKHHDGNFQLVAVEYAVPIALSPNAPPKGFTGGHDVWDYNTTFGLWTLHAWVFKNNPDGVFNPTNPLVHVIGAESMISCGPK